VLEVGEGGGVGLFIAGVARLARDHGVRRVTILREFVQLPRGNLIHHAAPPSNPSRFLRAYPFLARFSGGYFGGLLVFNMGHAAYLRKALDVYFPTI
jgi:hypothetical protein